MTDKDQCRAAYDRYQLDTGCPEGYLKFSHGDYHSLEVNHDWQVWQAAWAHQSAALAAAQEREGKLMSALYFALMSFSPRICHYGDHTGHEGTIRSDKLEELWAVYRDDAALSQPSQAPADDAAAEFGPVTEAELDAARVVLRQAPAQGEPADPTENLMAELAADVQEYAEPPQLDPVHNALLHASSWISHVPHGDNCFLMNEGEYNRCYCGRDALLGAIDDALVIVESEDHKLVPIDPTTEMIHAGMRPGIGFYETGEITEEMAEECYRAMIAAAPSGKEGE